MPENKEPGKDGEESTPSQIPLLVDVVPPGSTQNNTHHKPPKPHGDQEALDLDPDPPQTTDLFIDNVEDTVRDHSLGIRGLDASKMNAGLTPGDDRLSSQFRAQANELVDSLVKEYSDEILTRLREELTALLQELDADPDP